MVDKRFKYCVTLWFAWFTTFLPINALAIDSVSPVLSLIKPVAVSSRDTTPTFTFKSSESGTISYPGPCLSSQTVAVKGNNTITFDVLVVGSYSKCRIRVTDLAGNISLPFTLPLFKILPLLMPAGANPVLNDTGITLCSDSGISGIYQNKLDCNAFGVGVSVYGIDVDGDIVPAGQDAVQGRDANYATNSNNDGFAGFSFTKLDNNGSELPSSANSWVCVKDNITGLVWEVKTTDGGLRDMHLGYQWYNPDYTTNGGFAGVVNNGVCSSATGCNTKKYVADVNASNLCGANDWRLPSVQELLSIVANNQTKPSINTRYFPNTDSNYYWTSTPFADDADMAWTVFFQDGSYTGYYSQKSYKLRVRLVRGGE